MTRKNVNNEGMKGEYDKMTLNLIEDQTIKTDKLSNQFPEIERDAKDLLPEEFAGQVDDVTLGSDSNPEIKHADNPHSFEHDIPESAKVTGQRSSGLKGE